MICPFCLTNLKRHTASCSKCSRPLPPDYVKDHSGLLTRGPAIVNVVGFRGHGKTLYLSSLYYALQNLLSGVWPDFHRQGRTFETVKILHEKLTALKKGELPDPTQNFFPEPNVDRLYRIPKYGDRTLLIYDVSGEAFDLFNEDDFKKFAGFVRYSRCALFLISLDDLMKEYDYSLDLHDAVADKMHQLLERYNQGMTSMGAQSRSQHLIVVFTKADCLLQDYRMPEKIKTYLESREMESLRDIRGYLQVMQQISTELRDYAAHELNARNFLGNATNHFQSVEFCAVSSLGAAPQDGRLSERVAPRRVVDPLLWVLDKS